MWRHPIYLFYVLTFLGVSLVVQQKSWLMIATPILILGVGVYLVFEERKLMKRFSGQYHEHRIRTGIIIPRLPFVLRLIIIPFFKLKYGYRITRRENLPTHSPFFVVANHRNYLDPFFIANALPFAISFISTSSVYGSNAMRWIMNKAFAVPRKRYRSDPVSIRKVIKLVQAKAVIGVFAEGERHWTGSVQDFKPESLHLFKKFRDIPILPVKVKGAYNSWPRWARSMRKGRVELEFGKAIKLDPEYDNTQLNAWLKELVNPNDLDNPTYACRSKNLTEGIDKVIYRCPHCQQFDSLQPIDLNEIGCESCGNILKLSPSYELMYEVDNQQKTESLDSLMTRIRITSNDLPDQDDEILVMRSFNAEIQVRHGSNLTFAEQRPIELYRDRLIISGYGSFKLANLTSATTESNCILQLYAEQSDQLVQLKFHGESVLKWQHTILESLRKYHQKEINYR